MKTVYRTRGHLLAGLLIGIAAFATFSVEAAVSHGTGRIVASLLAVVLGGFSVLRLARAGLFLDGREFTILNPFQTVKFPWSEARRFELGSYDLPSPIAFLSPIAIVELTDGRRIHIFGIQATPSRAAAERLVASLNETLLLSRRGGEEK